MCDFKTVQEAWTSFSSQCIPPNASPVQYSEMKNSFYAGFTAILCFLKHWKYDDDPEKEEIDLIHRLKKFDDEVSAFAKSLDGDRKLRALQELVERLPVEHLPKC